MDLVWSDFVKWWELFHFFVFQILWCLYMIIHVCSSSRRKIKGNEYKLRTIRTLSCPVSCIFMNKPKQKYNQATNKTGKDKIKWIALIQPGFNHVNLKLESKFWLIWIDSYSRGISNWCLLEGALSQSGIESESAIQSMTTSKIHF